MRALSSSEAEVQDILHRGGTWTTSELSEEVGVRDDKVRMLVKKLRKKYLENHPEVARYVFTTKGGYTIDEKPEHVMYEARMRMAMGTGVLFNGVYVFKRGRKIALQNYKKLRIEYKPKLLQIEKL